MFKNNKIIVWLFCGMFTSYVLAGSQADYQSGLDFTNDTSSGTNLSNIATLLTVVMNMQQLGGLENQLSTPPVMSTAGGNPGAQDLATLQTLLASSNNPASAADTLNGSGGAGDQKVNFCTNYTGTDQTVVAQCQATLALYGTRVSDYRTSSGFSTNDSIFTANSMAGQAATAISGVPQTQLMSSIVGLGIATTGGGTSCTTVTGTGLPTQTTGQCSRAVTPSSSSCNTTVIPAVTVNKACNISGTSYVYSVHQPSWNYWVPQSNGTPDANGLGTEPLYYVNWSCYNATQGIARVYPFPGSNGYQMWYGWECAHGCWMGGGGNSGPVPAPPIYFSPGVTSAPVTWATLDGYGGTHGTSSTAWYDGTTNKIIVQNNSGPPSGTIGWPAKSCPASYNWVSDAAIYSWQNVCSGSGFYSSCSYQFAPALLDGYCTNPSDLTSISISPFSTPTAGTCQIDYNVGAWACQDMGNLSFNAPLATCSVMNAACQYNKASCDSNHKLTFKSYASDPHTPTNSTCEPKLSQALNYTTSQTGYGGAFGQAATMTVTVLDQCSAMSSQSPAPPVTAKGPSIPALNLNGGYSCPAGYIVSTINLGWCDKTYTNTYAARISVGSYTCNGSDILINGVCYVP